MGLTFPKPKCNIVLQPDPRSGEGCNIYYPRALQTLIHGKECYIVILYTFLAIPRVYGTITEQHFETTGRGFQSRKYMVALGFIPIITPVSNTIIRLFNGNKRRVLSRDARVVNARLLLMFVTRHQANQVLNYKYLTAVRIMHSVLA